MMKIRTTMMTNGDEDDVENDGDDDGDNDDDDDETGWQPLDPLTD